MEHLKGILPTPVEKICDLVQMFYFHYLGTGLVTSFSFCVHKLIFRLRSRKDRLKLPRTVINGLTAFYRNPLQAPCGKHHFKHCQLVDGGMPPMPDMVLGSSNFCSDRAWIKPGKRQGINQAPKASVFPAVPFFLPFNTLASCTTSWAWHRLALPHCEMDRARLP